MVNQELIKQYITEGGVLFKITLLTSYRDGGTKVIETTYGTFYGDKKENTLHDGYPTTEENKLKDSLLEFYLLERLTHYIKRQEEDANYNKSFLLKVLDTYGQ